MHLRLLATSSPARDELNSQRPSTFLFIPMVQPATRRIPIPMLKLQTCYGLYIIQLIPSTDTSAVAVCHVLEHEGCKVDSGYVFLTVLCVLLVKSLSHILQELRWSRSPGVFCNTEHTLPHLCALQSIPILPITCTHTHVSVCLPNFTNRKHLTCAVHQIETVEFHSWSPTLVPIINNLPSKEIVHTPTHVGIHKRQILSIWSYKRSTIFLKTKIWLFRYHQEHTLRNEISHAIVSTGRESIFL